MLFEEKIELFAQLLEEKPVTWNGTTYPVRVASVKHTIEPSTDMRRPVEWRATYECEPAATIARGPER